MVDSSLQYIIEEPVIFHLISSPSQTKCNKELP